MVHLVTWSIKGKKMHNSFKKSALISATLAAIVLGACSTPTPSLPPTDLRNPIQVAESIERLELYARPNGLELSARDKLAVAQFLDGYRNGGDGPLYMNKPAGAQGGIGTRQAEAVIRGLMAEGGINPMALQSGQYQSPPNAPAPVVVSYRTLKAIPQKCGRLGSLSDTYNNQPYDNFGCFQSANIAAMISDPRQLLEPYTQGNPNAQRRQVVYDKYIKGELSASEFPTRQLLTADDD